MKDSNNLVTGKNLASETKSMREEYQNKKTTNKDLITSLEASSAEQITQELHELL